MVTEVLTDHTQLLLTDIVYRKCPQFEGAWQHVADCDETVAVVVLRDTRTSGDRFLILDGNHRSVAAALLNREVVLHIVESDHDADELLELEADGTIAPFPHRRFLAGSMTFDVLRADALHAAQEVMRDNSAADVAAILARDF